ncbi:hypothetical protein [Robertkochia sediminum]|uniref:hypothetical protein n=1 Tax=Robertkochia sediminum TaxID=2785326 RepID=UPI001932545E|nr:hypothetical protein [Robertkochia sediminum]MBL7471353.1 hypothetical protein [Robertkochia sediminum]
MNKTILLLRKGNDYIEFQRIVLGLHKQYWAQCNIWNEKNYYTGNYAVCATFASMWQTVGFTSNPFEHVPECPGELRKDVAEVIEKALKEQWEQGTLTEEQKIKWLHFIKP